MKIEFNNWVEMLKTVIELGKENGYEIYDESNSEDLRIYKEINKSCKYNNTVFLSYENKEVPDKLCSFNYNKPKLRKVIIENKSKYKKIHNNI